MPDIARVRVSTGRSIDADRLIVGRFRGEPPVLEGLAGDVARLGGELGASRAVSATARVRGLELAVLELGPRAEFTGREDLGAWIEKRVRAAREDGIERLALLLPSELLADAETTRFVLRQLFAAGYAFERYRKRDKRKGLRDIQLVVPGAVAGRAARGALRDASAVAAGVALTRELANAPPNDAHPLWMTARARELARRHGWRVTVLGVPELRRRGMGGLLAVGGGSRHPPRLVRIDAGRGPRTVALVGKGVTFDTGGISIKPAAAMDEMKYDKSGACTVLGILEAAAGAGLGVRLRAYLPLAENMLGGAAYRPGDIVRCANGATVEITNTDAEGRMILADALSWAATDRPDEILEFSTLTGACVVALGQSTAGLFTPNEALAGELLAAAGRAGEPVWRLPMGKRFLADLEGGHADLRNLGGRWGGASVAASFLGEFAKPIARFAHFDIAGPAYVGHDGGPGRGATGFGVATVVEWLAAGTGAAVPPRRRVARRREPRR